jgi:hypothetical protein
MPKKSPTFTLEEVSGDQYPDLVTAQQAALKATVADLVGIIRSLLASGVLIQKDGKVILNPSRLSNLNTPP